MYNPSAQEFMRNEFRIKFDQVLQRVETTWETLHRFPRCLYLWAGDNATYKEKTVPNGTVFIHPLEAHEDLKQEAQKLVQTLNAPAFVAIERVNNKLHVLLESIYGSNLGVYPIYRSIDIDVLGQKETSTDVISLDILWRPAKKNKA